MNPYNPRILNPQIIGQAERAHAAILGRILSGSNVTGNQSITVNLVMFAGGSLDHSALIDRLAEALLVSISTAQETIAETINAGLLAREGADINATDAGKAYYQRFRAVSVEALTPAYADIPADDLAIAARVLTTITERIRHELRS